MSDDEKRWHGFGYNEDEHWYEYDFGVAVGWVDGCIVLRWKGDDRSKLTLTPEEWALVANGVRDLIHVELDYEPADPLETWIGERARERQQPEQP